MFPPAGVDPRDPSGPFTEAAPALAVTVTAASDPGCSRTAAEPSSTVTFDSPVNCHATSALPVVALS